MASDKDGKTVRRTMYYRLRIEEGRSCVYSIRLRNIRTKHEAILLAREKFTGQHYIIEQVFTDSFGCEKKVTPSDKWIDGGEPR